MPLNDRRPCKRVNELVALVYNLLRTSFIDRSDALWLASVSDRVKITHFSDERQTGTAVKELTGRIDRWATRKRRMTQGPMATITSILA